MEEKFKDLRVEIDRNIKLTRVLAEEILSASQPGGRELALVHTKLQEAKMWVGKVIEEQGSKLPEEFRDEYKG